MMSKYTSISYECLNWIIESLANGYTAPSLVKTMVEKGFDEIVAGQTVSRIAVLMNTELELNKGVQNEFIYETPRFPMKENIIQTSDRDIQVVARVDKPVVVVLDNLLSHEECDELVTLAKKKKMRRSLVLGPRRMASVDPERTSSGTSFEYDENQLITRLDRRIAEVMNCPVQNGEKIHILNYQIGKEYKPHFDYFPVTTQGSKSQRINGGQRTSTLIIYLNNVVAGGETIFPEIGLSIVPKKGSAVYFEYFNSLGQVDPLTLHGGSPVIQGEKWIATKWMRQGRR